MSQTNETGLRNPFFGLDAAGFADPASVAWNLAEVDLLEAAVRRGEGRLTADGALAVETGRHTGRSARDKYVVRDAETEGTVWWENNQAMEPQAFARLHADFLAHAAGRDLFVQDLAAGTEAANRFDARVVTEFAWHALFVRNLLVRPEAEAVRRFAPDLTIVDFPSFRADPARHGTRGGVVVACDLSRRIVLIGGTSYAGEMKKAVFTLLNHLLPARGVLPMHCAANVGADGGAAVFFGLSGTGKTTLSADPARALVGDDEHGWGEAGVFNFEGGCYAKTIRLSAEAEPAIFAATRRFGTVLENVPLDVERRPDLDDARLTENTRAAYPLDAIGNAVPGGRAGHPRDVVMLAADAFGVLPPIARLSPDEAAEHFLSGYTAKVAGTEKGVAAPEATFSACFGAPFMPRPPEVYGAMLRERIARHGVRCWLVNTGWTGGPYGTGTRMPIAATRRLLAAALGGELDDADFRRDPTFGFAVPVRVPGVDPALLDPRSTWADSVAYDAQAARLLALFRANLRRFEPEAAAPPLLVAAEGGALPRGAARATLPARSGGRKGHPEWRARTVCGSTRA